MHAYSKLLYICLLLWTGSLASLAPQTSLAPLASLLVITECADKGFNRYKAARSFYSNREWLLFVCAEGWVVKAALLFNAYRLFIIILFGIRLNYTSYLKSYVTFNSLNIRTFSLLNQLVMKHKIFACMLIASFLISTISFGEQNWRHRHHRHCGHRD